MLICLPFHKAAGLKTKIKAKVPATDFLFLTFASA
jgi:hypothetical protein